jgi:hypothetical protein
MTKTPNNDHHESPDLPGEVNDESTLDMTQEQFLQGLEELPTVAFEDLVEAAISDAMVGLKEVVQEWNNEGGVSGRVSEVAQAILIERVERKLREVFGVD